MGALVIGAAVGAVTVGAWFGSRRIGRGRPCPVWLAVFFDNPYTHALSASSKLVERADVIGGMRVLDAGCGPGRLTIPLARRVGTTGEVVALDVQAGMLERVRRNAAKSGVTNVRTILGPLESQASALTGESERFDRVLLVTVLGEMPERAGALRSLWAVLKPGGILSITEMIIDPDYQPRHRVRRLAEDAGFQFDRSYGTPLMFTMNFRRPT
jgi:ubiquinone/menaquinone biosynthesis C-methylase UbiE